MSPCVRMLGPQDIDAVVAVENQSFPIPWSQEAFEAELVDNDLACYLGVVVDGCVVGYGGMWLILDEAHITNIAVLPEYRGRGLGTLLMTEMLQLAKAKGAVRMTLEVRTGNVVAQKLYAAMGFKQGGIRPQYYTDTKEDALIMWLDNL